MSAQPHRSPLKRPQAILLVAALLLMATLALAYGVYAAKQPNAVLNQALELALQLKSAGFDIRVETTETTDNGDKPGPQWQISGHIDRQGKLEAGGNYQTDGHNVSFEIRSPQGSNTYAQLEGAENLPSILGDRSTAYGLPSTSSPLQGLNKRWLEIPDILKQATVQNWLFVGKADGGLTATDQQQLAALYRRHAFVSVSRYLGEENLDGSSARHYRLRLDQTELVTYLQAVKRGLGRLQVTDEQITAAANTADTLKDIEVWVNQDGLIHRLHFEQLEAGKQTTTTVNFSAFNRAVIVSRPADSTPLFQLLSQLQTATKPTATVPAKR